MLDSGTYMFKYFMCCDLFWVNRLDPGLLFAGFSLISLVEFLTTMVESTALHIPEMFQAFHLVKFACRYNLMVEQYPFAAP